MTSHLFARHDDPARLFTALGLAAVLVAGCIGSDANAAKRRRPEPDSGAFAATIAPAPVVPARPNGSIFQVANGYTPLTSGARASSVGDIITIALVERTQAQKTNSAGTDRSGNIGLTPPITGPLSFFSSSDASMGGGSNFSGKGQAQQSNALSGEITVTIAEVYPNGTMLVRGQKLLTLNRGDEYITISGIVRGVDITPDNRIASTRVADARITYTGKGELARASKQGWLQRFFSIISPF